MPQISFSSPVGDLTIQSDGTAIVVLEWGITESQGTSQNSTRLLNSARAQILAYFSGDLENFDLPLAPAGTAFQQKVWAAMQKIPYGDTQTYGALARDIHSGPRPVGTACGANPIPILIPCHRVVAAHGLGGYSGEGGLATKQTLLALEGQQLAL